MIDLTGKVILVTGGSRGIGAGIVEVLAGAGADVILHYNASGKEAEAVARKAGAKKCHLVQADLSDPQAVQSAMAAKRDAAMSWPGVTRAPSCSSTSRQTASSASESPPAA